MDTTTATIARVFVSGEACQRVAPLRVIGPLIAPALVAAGGMRGVVSMDGSWRRGEVWYQGKTRPAARPPCWA